MSALELAHAFEDAGVEGFFHAVDLESREEVSHQADSLVVPASVFKVPVLLELHRQGASGEIDLTAQVPIPVEGRAPGPTGLSVFSDGVSASLRDLGVLMMSISDNAATDVITDRIGLDRVQATVEELGLQHTQISDDCRTLISGMCDDLGISALRDVPVPLTVEDLAKLRSHDPARATTRTTPRDMTTLLDLVWSDRAGPPEACAQVRHVLGLQVWPHRLASGFADLDEVRTPAKTGTLLGIRNEVGVVEYPDGGRIAVACFTRAFEPTAKHARADAVIGQAARLAVDHLRRNR